MIKRISLIIIFLFSLLIILGTIGFAETHSYLYYNQFALIHWIHPGDGCDSGNYCFYIQKKDGKYSWFSELYRSFQKINIPTDKSMPLIFAQSSLDGSRLVYNLKTETYLIQKVSYIEALMHWKAYGLKEPEFSDASTGAKGLYKTWSSRFGEWIWMALLFMPLFVILALPAFTFFTFRFAKKFKSTRQEKYFIMFIIVLVPSLLLWLLILRFFGFIFLRI